MILNELTFQAYYRQYFILEADELTECFSDVVNLTQEDCYVLCTSHIQEDGQLVFPVLSLGDHPNRCRKGLYRKAMLGCFNWFQVSMCAVYMIKPTWQMIKKSAAYLMKQKYSVGAEIQAMRLDPRLNAVRLKQYPDCVLSGLVTDRGIVEVPIHLLGYNGPFIEGKIAVNPNINGIKKDELVRALPYVQFGSERLLSVFVGDHLSETDEANYRKLIAEGNAQGFGFACDTKKS